ncbi:MAG: hydrogenase 4 subunit B, partial [Nitrospirae bacterium CG_4_9_14_3_um_filter_51_5]
MTELLFFALLLAYACGMFLPLCFPSRPHIQNVIAHGLAAVAGGLGIVLGLIGLLGSEPLTLSLPSSIPLLAFSLRLDSLSGFFVFTISLVGLAVSIFASGYVREFYGRIPVSLLGFLYNGFLLSMLLVVMADNAFFFLIVWELMSLL